MNVELPVCVEVRHPTADVAPRPDVEWSIDRSPTGFRLREEP